MSASGGSLVEYDDPSNIIMCNNCVKRRATNPSQRCFAHKPFTSCSQCANNSTTCDYATQQRMWLTTLTTGSGMKVTAVVNKLKLNLPMEVANSLILDLSEVSSIIDLDIGSVERKLTISHDVV